MGNFGGWGYNEGVRDGDALGWGWGSCPQTRCRAVTPTSRRCCIKPGWKICSGGRASLGQPGLFGLRGGCFGSCCRCVLEERGMSGAGKKKKIPLSLLLPICHLPAAELQMLPGRCREIPTERLRFSGSCGPQAAPRQGVQHLPGH